MKVKGVKATAGMFGLVHVTSKMGQNKMLTSQVNSMIQSMINVARLGRLYAIVATQHKKLGFVYVSPDYYKTAQELIEAVQLLNKKGFTVFFYNADENNEIKIVP